MLVERADAAGKWTVKLVPFDGGEPWQKEYTYNVESVTHFADVIPKFEADGAGAFLEGLGRAWRAQTCRERAGAAGARSGTAAGTAGLCGPVQRAVEGRSRSDCRPR